MEDPQPQFLIRTEREIETLEGSENNDGYSYLKRSDLYGPGGVPFTMYITGPTGSGKTSLLRDIVQADDRHPLLDVDCTDLTYFTETGDYDGMDFLKPYAKRFSFLIPFGSYSADYRSQRAVLGAGNKGNLPHHIMIFDDIPLDSNRQLVQRITDYFRQGRHVGISCILLSQIPFHRVLQGVRENAQITIAINLSERQTRNLTGKQDYRNLGYRLFAYNKSSRESVIERNRTDSDIVAATINSRNPTIKRN